MTVYARWLAKKFWGTFALLLILMAVFVQTGRMLSPLVEENREEIVQYLGEHLQLQIAVDQLSFEWAGMRPELKFSNLAIYSDNGDSILLVERADAQLDLLATLLDWQLRLWRVELDNVSVSFTQNDQGHLRLRGVPTREVGDSSSQRQTGQIDLINQLLIGRYIHFQNIDLDFYLADDSLHQLQLNSLLLQNDDDFHRVTASLKDAHQRQLVRFVFEGEGNPKDYDAFSGCGELVIDQLPLQENLSLLAAQLKNVSDLQGSELSTHLWFESSPQQRLAWQGWLSFSRPLDGSVAQYESVPQDDSTLASDMSLGIPYQFNAEVTGVWQPDHFWQLALQDSVASWGEIQSPIVNASVTGDADGLRLQSSQVVLKPWIDLVKASRFSPEKLVAVLNDLSPEGTLNQLDLALPKNALKDFTLKANLDGVSTQPRKAVPGITSLNGYVELGAIQGTVDIDSSDDFAIFFPKVYQEAIALTRASGQVAWRVDREKNQVLVNSGLLHLAGSVGDASGYFYLDAPFQPQSRPTELYLQIGLQNSELPQHKTLVPYVLPDSLLSWLDAALQEGAVPDAGFLLRSYFGKTRPGGRSVQLALNAEQGRLKFDPNWPELTAADVFLRLDNNDLEAYVSQARLFSSDISNAGVRLNPNLEGEGSLLKISGAVDGHAADGLAALTQTPLRDVLGSTFDHWLLQGNLHGELELAIPLLAEQPGAFQDVRMQLGQAHLNMQDIGLQFDALNGAIRYSSEQGLSAPNLTANLWQQPLKAVMTSELATEGHRTRIDFSSTINARSVADWLKSPEVRFFEGDAAVSGFMTLPAPSDDADYAARLQLASDLEGVAVHLPSGFGKSTQDVSELNVDIKLAGLHQDYYLSYGLVDAHLRQKSGRLSAGLVQVGGSESIKAELNDSAEELLITGVIDQADFDQWLDVFDRYGTFSNEHRQASNSSDSSPIDIRYDLNLQRFQWDSLLFDDVAIKGKRLSEAWLVDVGHPIASGEILVGDAQPLKIDLQYLHWPDDNTEASAERLGASDDPLSDFNPIDLPQMSVSVADVKLGDTVLGQWQFDVEPIDDGARFTHLNAMVTGVKIGSGLSDDNVKTGAELIWRKTSENHVTAFDGVLSSRDLPKVLSAWQQPKLLDSDTARLDVQLSWFGSPAAINLAGLQGDVAVNVKKGRFFQVSDQANNALLRLFGLFNFDSWARRLRLDFSDLYGDGMAFDRIEGNLKFADGQIFLPEPLEVKTPSAKLAMGGQIDLRNETLNTSMVATLPVSNNATLIAAFAAGLPVAAGVYAVSRLFQNQVDRVASVSYEMNGEWADPQVKFNKLFDNKAADKASKDIRQASKAAQEKDRQQGEELNRPQNQQQGASGGE